ncbi:BDR-repeat family protein (plasmid) [Borrelia nietonii YOR]|uniref:BDR-repeat family protein n=1 Tax=Borrelia nietonii YOR TaxID=1293576 RepID=W5SAP2_9SPIR|nr:BDR-repeat family protein [Borrelia nietonii YOR]
MSYRYYRNELTYKDIEYVKKNFDIKSEPLERGLKADIKELDNKIDTKFNELDNKINNVENNLNVKIDTNTMELKTT